MEANDFYQNLYSWFDGYLPESLDWLVYTLSSLVMVIAVINTLVVTVALYSWFERRILARFQVRIGPNRWGPFGLFREPFWEPFGSLLGTFGAPFGTTFGIIVSATFEMTFVVTFGGTFRSISGGPLFRNPPKPPFRYVI